MNVIHITHAADMTGRHPYGAFMLEARPETEADPAWQYELSAPRWMPAGSTQEIGVVANGRYIGSSFTRPRF